jgi:hypothetical protein
MRPTDFTGRFVFHCHVTNHEDRGMMMAIQVVRHPTRRQLAGSIVQAPGMRIESAAYGRGGGGPVFARAAGVILFICHLATPQAGGSTGRAPVRSPRPAAVT